MYFGIYFRFYFQDLFQDRRGGGFKLIKLKTTHKFVESQAAKAVVGQTIY